MSPENLKDPTAPPRVFALDILGPRVTLQRFSQMADSALSLLREVDSQVARKPGGVLEWVVSDLRTGSVHLEARPEPRQASVDPEAALRVLEAVGEGLEAIEEAPTRPRYFSDAALTHARRLAGALSEEGVVGVQVLANGRRISISQRLAGHVDELVKPRLRSIGSVEGQLETVSVHGAAYFNVYDAVTGRAVKCSFPDAMLDKVRAALAKRVLVSGTVWSRQSGEVVTIQAKRLELFPQEADISPADAVRGVLRRD